MASSVEVLNHADILDYAMETLRGVSMLLQAMTEQGSQIESPQLVVLADALNSAAVNIGYVRDDIKSVS